jgi:hypothetical protein
MRLSLAPLTVEEVLAALLQAPPPPAERKAPKKRKMKGSVLPWAGFWDLPYAIFIGSWTGKGFGFYWP